MAHHAGRVRAEQIVLQAGPVRRHHDQVDADFSRRHKDFVVDRSLRHDPPRLDARGNVLAGEGGEPLVGLGKRLPGEIFGELLANDGHAKVGHNGEQVKPRPERAASRDGDRQCLGTRAFIVEVDRQQNVFVLVPVLSRTRRRPRPHSFCGGGSAARR